MVFVSSTACATTTNEHGFNLETTDALLCNCVCVCVRVYVFDGVCGRCGYQWTQRNDHPARITDVRHCRHRRKRGNKFFVPADTSKYVSFGPHCFACVLEISLSTLTSAVLAERHH